MEEDVEERGEEVYGGRGVIVCVCVCVCVFVGFGLRYSESD